MSHQYLLVWAQPDLAGTFSCWTFATHLIPASVCSVFNVVPADNIFGSDHQLLPPPRVITISSLPLQCLISVCHHPGRNKGSYGTKTLIISTSYFSCVVAQTAHIKGHCFKFHRLHTYRQSKKSGSPIYIVHHHLRHVLQTCPADRSGVIKLISLKCLCVGDGI